MIKSARVCLSSCSTSCSTSFSSGSGMPFLVHMLCKIPVAIPAFTYIDEKLKKIVNRIVTTFSYLTCVETGVSSHVYRGYLLSPNSQPFYMRTESNSSEIPTLASTMRRGLKPANEPLDLKAWSLSQKYPKYSVYEIPFA